MSWPVWVLSGSGVALDGRLLGGLACWEHFDWVELLLHCGGVCVAASVSEAA
jgi:hypothetical protein